MLSGRKAALLSVAMIFTVLFSDIVRTSILNSLQLCTQTLIPALLPSFVLCGMILDCGIDLILPPAWAAFFIGLLCGYPIGSSTVCRLYSGGKLNKAQAEGLLMCTANASPAFVVIVVGSTILESKQLGYTILLIQTLISFILFLQYVPKKTNFFSSGAQSITIGTALINNIKKAAEQLLFVCTCTTVFGIIFDILSQSYILHSKILKHIIAMTELTHGLSLYGAQELYSITAILGFSGLAILTQCAYYVQKTDLRFRFVFIGKLQYALLMPGLVYLLFPGNAHKPAILVIIILTNVLTMCIIRHKGCEKEYDFFKRNRKMLCLLRKGNKDRNERTSALSS